MILQLPLQVLICEVSCPPVPLLFQPTGGSTGVKGAGYGQGAGYGHAPQGEVNHKEGPRLLSDLTGHSPTNVDRSSLEG